jgi:fibronectin-binding autotransporter adhesin
MKRHIEITEKFSRKALKIGSACLWLSMGLLASNTAQAQSQYFTSSVANGGTYSWDGANWSISGGTSSGPFTSAWTAGDFARFYGGAGDAYTVTVNTSESMAGMFLNAGTGVSLSVNDAGGGTGSLSVTPDTSQASQNGFSWLTQGFLTGGGSLTLNAPISGTGGIEEESGGGTLALYGNNSYTGGTLFTSSSTFVAYNNNNSFGAVSSQIGYDGTTFSLMENTGPSTVNIANPVQVIGTTGVDFIGNSATMSGSWTLGANTVNLRNNGVGTTETLSGIISGTGTVTFSGANGGFMVLGAKNTFSGTMVVGSSGDTAVTLQLGTGNAIASLSQLTLSGGTLNLGGFTQAMGFTPLGLTASSTIDFTAAGSTLQLANSSAQAWTGTLDLVNWNPAVDFLEVGTSSSGLTPAQLDDIEFNGAGLGTAQINALGDISAVPEPPTVILGVVGGLTMMWRMRRRTI